MDLVLHGPFFISCARHAGQFFLSHFSPLQGSGRCNVTFNNTAASSTIFSLICVLLQHFISAFVMFSASMPPGVLGTNIAALSQPSSTLLLGFPFRLVMLLLLSLSLFWSFHPAPISLNYGFPYFPSCSTCPAWLVQGQSFSRALASLFSYPLIPITANFLTSCLEYPLSMSCSENLFGHFLCLL